MSIFYSHNGAYPVVLPNRIVLSNGRSRTDKSSFTAEEIADAGWVAVSDPPTVTYPNKLDWDGTNWVVREPNAQEISDRWREVRSIRDKKILQTDIYVIKAYEQGVPVDSVIVEYRTALRDLPQNTVNPFHVTWPTQPE